MEVAPADLADAVRGARAFGMRGFNLTIPHKVAVMEHLDEIAPEAAVIGAVNTVRRDGRGRLIGENTDGKGFLRGVRQDAGVDPKGRRAVVLGAGGAARAIVTELALAGASDVLVVNRSPGARRADGGRPRCENRVVHPLRAVARRLPGPRGRRDLRERHLHRPLPRRRRHARGRFHRRLAGPAGVRRGLQPARDEAAGGRERARTARCSTACRCSSIRA